MSFCGVGFYIAFAFDFVSVMHGGIPFFSLLKSVWYWNFVFQFGMIVICSGGCVTILPIFLIVYQMCGWSDNPGLCNIPKENWIYFFTIIGNAIIFDCLFALVVIAWSQFGIINVLDYIYLGCAIYGAIFVYIVFPEFEMCFDFYKQGCNVTINQDKGEDAYDLPPFFNHAYMFLLVWVCKG